MGEAYTEQDLRRAESLLNDSSIGSTDEGGFATDEAKRCLAAEFAAVRRERDQRAEKLAWTLRQIYEARNRTDGFAPFAYIVGLCEDALRAWEGANHG